MRSSATAVLRCLGLDFRNQAKREFEAESRVRARNLAVRFSRGSVRIQANAFITTADLEAERKNARQMKF